MGNIFQVRMIFSVVDVSSCFLRLSPPTMEVLTDYIGVFNIEDLLVVYNDNEILEDLKNLLKRLDYVKFIKAREATLQMIEKDASDSYLIPGKFTSVPNGQKGSKPKAKIVQKSDSNVISDNCSLCLSPLEAGSRSGICDRCSVPSSSSSSSTNSSTSSSAVKSGKKKARSTEKPRRTASRDSENGEEANSISSHIFLNESVDDVLAEYMIVNAISPECSINDNTNSNDYSSRHPVAEAQILPLPAPVEALPLASVMGNYNGYEEELVQAESRDVHLSGLLNVIEDEVSRRKGGQNGE
jgi:hypothetical protein